MRLRRLATVCFAAGVLVSCSSTTAPKGASKPAVKAVTALPPGECGTPEALPPGGQVSFVTGIRVFTVSPTGAGLACVAELDTARPIQWGPAGDRLLVAGFESVDVVQGAESETLTGLGTHPRSQGFSLPTGGNVVFISADGAVLSQTPLGGGKPVDISFLRRHDEATFHPSGAQIAVIGEHPDHRYGIWLATNEGREAKLIVPVSTEDEFYGLTYSHDGNTLYYVGDEHDHWVLNALDLTNPKATPEEVVSEPVPVTAPVVSLLSNETIAWRRGDCDSGLQTFVHDDKGTRRVASSLGDTQPIGWLPDGTLLVAASDDLCDPQRTLDLYIVHEDKQSILVRDVAQAAVRVTFPPPPGPPADIAGDPTGE
jgi:hypothetical protein